MKIQIKDCFEKEKKRQHNKGGCPLPNLTSPFDAYIIYSYIISTQSVHCLQIRGLLPIYCGIKCMKL